MQMLAANSLDKTEYRVLWLYYILHFSLIPATGKRRISMLHDDENVHKEGMEGSKIPKRYSF